MNVPGCSEVVFTPVPCPTDQQLAAIVTAVRKKFIRRVRRACGLSREAAGNLLSWKNSGFSIHEEVLIKNWDREGLERLLGYCSRPALSRKRLVYAEKANMVLYRTEPKAGKSEMLVMTPIEFLRRWTLLMPPPNKNLVHYYGALAPSAPGNNRAQRVFLKFKEIRHFFVLLQNSRKRKRSPKIFRQQKEVLSAA